MVRDAKFSDIPAIMGLLTDAYERTHYAKSGLVQIDVDEAKGLLVGAIRLHDEGGAFIQVAERRGKITGLIVGTLARAYSIGNKLLATDLFWLASPDVDPRDPARLMKNMLDWARNAPNVIEAVCATTAIINIDPRQAGRILKRLGMTEHGILYRTEFAA